jgi:ubiquinone/menaquinone biosynthesis C-methylase UbiE
MATSGSYIIQGGVQGRERLRLLSRVMRPTTLSLLDRVGVGPGDSCLDVGCGGGDVTADLARRVGPGGRAVGTDFDEKKIDLARAEAADQRLSNIEFRLANASDAGPDEEFDVVYSRFLLTHLTDPAAALANMCRAVRVGGVVVLEDIDFTGSFCYPPNRAYDRYVELYTLAVQKRGADPNIGPRLPGMLQAAGCERVDMNVVQPAGITGEAKLVTPITMENIGDAVRENGLADAGEIASIVSDLYDFAHDPRSVMGVPRIVQSWGYRTA